MILAMNRWAWAAAAALVLFLALLVWILAVRGRALPPESHVVAPRTSFGIAVSKGLHVAGHYYLVVAYAAVLAFYLWTRKRRREAIAAIVAVLALAGAVKVTKQTVSRARPDPAQQVIRESGGSFPSGHASGTMALGLILVAQARRRWLWGVAATLAILAMGLSRLCLGVHYPSDVVGGWLIGTAAASVAIYFSNAPMSTAPPCGRTTPSKS